MENNLFEGKRIDDIILNVIEDLRATGMEINEGIHDDLMQVGYMAVLRAKKNFDTKWMQNFTQYVTVAVARALKRYIYRDSVVSIPEYVVKKGLYNSAIGEEVRNLREVESLEKFSERLVAESFEDDILKKDQVQRVINILCDVYGTRDGHILAEYYFYGKRNVDIALEFKVSETRIGQIIKKVKPEGLQTTKEFEQYKFLQAKLRKMDGTATF